MPAFRRADAGDRFDAAAEVVDTARGPVEVQRRGDPPYVLIVHGTPQGHHAATFGEPFEAAGYGTFTPSRPGYLRTPIDTGRSFAEQADAMAAMLDALNIDQVAVYAISGGGPSSIEFAARHADRAAALILESAVSQSFRPPISDLMIALAFSSLARWIMDQMMIRTPRLAIDQLLRVESTLDAQQRARVVANIVAQPDKLRWLQRLLGDNPPMKRLRAGFDNDLEQFRNIDQLPLANVRSPTLVVHGTHDGDVPYEHAEHTAGEIAGAQLVTVERGWHLLKLSDGDEAYMRTELDWLQHHFPMEANDDAPLELN